jgi:hypothetical protein
VIAAAKLHATIFDDAHPPLAPRHRPAPAPPAAHAMRDAVYGLVSEFGRQVVEHQDVIELGEIMLDREDLRR